MTVALFPDNYACPGGCGGSGYLPEPDGSGWCHACPECEPEAFADGETVYDPAHAQIPF